MFKKCSTLLFVAVFIFSCSNKKFDRKTSINPEFAKYISAFTSGMVSTHTPIRVRLTSPAQGKLDAESAKSLFEFEPAINGTARWTDEYTVEFLPAGPLPQNEFYQARFHLNKLISPLAKNLGVFEFDFKTFKQHISIEVDDIKTYDKNDLTHLKLTCKILLADQPLIEDLQKTITVLHEGKTMQIEWLQNEGANVYYFQIDSIQRRKTPSSLIINFDGKPIKAKETGSQSVKIPALGQFQILNTKVHEEPNQYISIQFSDPLEENQDLSGLLELEGFSKYRNTLSKNSQNDNEYYYNNYNTIDVSIEDNQIKLFPPSHISGTKQLIIHAGIKNSLNQSLLNEEKISVQFEDLKPAARLLGDGVIIPNSEGLIFPFEAVNLNAVDVKIYEIYENNMKQFLQVNNMNGENQLQRVGKAVYKGRLNLISDKSLDYSRWNSFKLDISKLITPTAGALYRVELSFRKKYSLYPCANDEKAEDKSMAEIEDSKLDEDDQNHEYDMYDGDYYEEDYYEDYDYQQRDNPCHQTYYTQYNKKIARNIFSSNLGIIAKRGDNGKMTVAISNLINTKPESSVLVEVYNYQNQLLGSSSTGPSGIAEINITGKPYMLVAKKEAQRGYLRVDDGSSLSLSMFEVGGGETQKGLKGFLYGERGVWRPGDSLHLTFILQDKEHTLPPQYPVLLELYNPQGQLYKRVMNNKPVDYFYHFAMSTDANAPTGAWTAKVKAGGASFEQAIRIETIKPNRLKIQFTPNSHFVKANEPFSGKLQVNWMHGAIAKNLNTTINASLSPTKTAFKPFKDYIFDYPASDYSPEDIEVFDGSVDENGLADINADFSISDNAPGMMKANFLIRVFENGGDFSIDQFSTTISPYSHYVGLKMPEPKTKSYYLETDSTHKIQIATVDQMGNPVARQNLEVTIYKIDWRWWWENSNNNGLSSYRNNSSYKKVSEGTAYTNSKGMGTFPFKINSPEYGRYMVVITDPESKHVTGSTFYCDWPGWMDRSNRKEQTGATQLSFSLDKTTYKTGETAKVSIPSSSGARAFVSIETGSKILKAEYIETQDNTTDYAFAITKEMTPNIFVHVTLVQPHNFTRNDQPIRLYGVVPVMVEDPATRLTPVITMPKELRPQEKFTVQVKEKDAKEMTYTLAIVDEGLLDITHFKTPDPYNYFYAKEALGIKTFDMYDLVMGAFGGELSSLLAAGGSDEAEGKKGRKAQRFKPVVKFMGPFHLKAGTAQNHTITLPEYIGSVRTMVIAGHDNAYGSAEKSTPVKKPLMILATAPRVIGPDETFKVPVTVFVSDASIKNTQVSISVNGMLQVQGEKTKQVSFKKPGEETIPFEITSNKGIGIANIEVVATSGKETTKYTIEMDVRASNPVTTQTIEQIVQAGETKEIAYELFGYDGTNKASIELSAIPAIDLERRLNYLLQYPHGCVEQTTSSVFPQLFVGNFVDLPEVRKKEIARNIKAGITRLQSFQTYDGGFAYWPGNSDADSWGSNYAIHFLLEAEKQGYSLPGNLKNKMMEFQKKRAQNWSGGKTYYDEDAIQSYRLYTLALAGKSELGAMNRLREKKNLSNNAKWRLAASYLLAGQTEVAKKLTTTATTAVPKYQELSYTYGSDTRDQAMILETMVLMGDISKTKSLVDDISASLRSQNWMSTQSTAYSLLGLSKFMEKNKFDKSLNATVQANAQAAIKIISRKAMASQKLDIQKTKTGKIKISNAGGGMIYARLIMEGVPAQGQEQAANNHLSMQITYQDLDGNPIDVSALQQGTDFVAEVVISNPGSRGNLQELALTQIFPSGWEIMNTRFLEGSFAKQKGASSYDYQDVRDDRVYTYFDLNSNKKVSYKVVLNASYIGKYYLPATYCEAMYDHSINASNTGKWVQVVETGKLSMK